MMLLIRQFMTCDVGGQGEGALRFWHCSGLSARTTPSFW